MLSDLLKYKLLPKLRRLRYNHSENAKASYSQCGEDLIMQLLFKVLGIDKVIYLDVGAHHPTYLSNTYLFYKNGGRGVCIEPDPSLFEEFGKKRPHDVHLNCGVGTSAGEVDFFMMSTSTLNTFSKEEVKRYLSYGKQRIIKTVKIELRLIDEILEKYFKKCPNLVSLDIEGMDYPILESFNFGKYKPEVFCLETLSYNEDKSERKLTEIINLMHQNGYLTYADTYINTIFVDKAAWDNRP
jgi:FkbM family methyltransferase